jgi:uncharacterized protein YraI
LTYLAIGGMVALIITILLIVVLTIIFANQDRGGTGTPPTVVITAPTNNSDVKINTPVTVQATGSAPAGVARMELWVRGLKTNEAVSPAANGQPTLTASFQWLAEAPGTYTLEIRAYTAEGLVNVPTSVTVNVVGDDLAQVGTPTITPTPEPIETVPGNPSLTTRTDLNVRGGPGIEYDLLGLLPTGARAEIIGRDGTRQWWQIRFDPAADGRGWVSSDPAFAQSANVENVPVVQPPPTPTGSPTATAIPPTSTPTPSATPTATATSAPPTNTPEPTLTPTPQSTTRIEFNVSPTNIQGGECVRISWDVVGVREIYLNGGPVAGQGSIQACPEQTTAYRLRVIKLDGTEQIEEIQVEVVNPVSVKSSGALRMNPNDTLDIDDGDIPGDDFIWRIDGNLRRFEVQNGAQIAIMNNTNSIEELPRSACLNANYSVYTFIDASDSAPDPNNTLIAGRTICFKTNKDRIGKMRFPEYSTDRLRLEWLTWQR